MLYPYSPALCVVLVGGTLQVELACSSLGECCPSLRCMLAWCWMGYFQLVLSAFRVVVVCVLVLGIGFCGSLIGFGCFLPPSSSILPPPPPFLLSSSPSFSVSHLFRFQPCLVVFFSLLHPPWLRAKLWSFLDVNFLQGSVVTRVCFCGLGLSKAVCLA